MPILIVSSAQAAVALTARAPSASAPAARERIHFVMYIGEPRRVRPVARSREPAQRIPGPARNLATSMPACFFQGVSDRGRRTVLLGAEELIRRLGQAAQGASSLGSPVADPGLRLDDFGRGRIALDLGAQLADEDAQILRVLGMRRSPHGGENLAVGDDPTGVAEKDGEEIVFLRRQLDRNAVARNEALVEVHDDALDLDPRSGLGLARPVAERGAKPRCQFADPEWLLDVIVGAEIERFDFLRLAVPRGENDHRRLRELADFAQDVLAVAVRQPEIEHDEIGRAGRGLTKSLRARLRRQNLVAGGGQRDVQEPLDLRLVVDHENAIALHRSVLSIAVGSAPGRRMTMRVPLLRTAGLWATIVPPIASIRPRQIDRPSPVPGLRPSARPPR